MATGLGSYLTIIKAFSPEPRCGVTIRQLALKCGGSYGWAYATCSGMIRHGILRSLRVGSAVLCSVNPESESAILLLALASAEHTRGILMANQELALKAKQVLAALGDPNLCVLHTPAGFAVVETGSLTGCTVNGQRLLSLPSKELSTALKDATVLQNFEMVWRLALKPSA